MHFLRPGAGIIPNAYVRCPSALQYAHIAARATQRATPRYPLPRCPSHRRVSVPLKVNLTFEPEGCHCGRKLLPTAAASKTGILARICSSAIVFAEQHGIRVREPRRRWSLPSLRGRQADWCETRNPGWPVALAEKPSERSTACVPS